MNDNMKVEKGLNLIGGRAGAGKTKCIVDAVNKLSNHNKVLLLSLENSKQLLKERYELKDSENMIVIDIPTHIEEIPSYLNQYKPNYLCIDYLMLLQVKNNDYDIPYRLNTLNDYADKYDVKIIVSDYISSKDNEEKYNHLIYDKCKQILIVQSGVITRMK